MNCTYSAPLALRTGSFNGVMISWVNRRMVCSFDDPGTLNRILALKGRSFALEFWAFTCIFQVCRLLHHVLLLWLYDTLVHPLWHQGSDAFDLRDSTILSTIYKQMAGGIVIYTFIALGFNSYSGSYRSKLPTEVLDFPHEESVDYRRSIFLLQED